jgi:hypothetical protein
MTKNSALRIMVYAILLIFFVGVCIFDSHLRTRIQTNRDQLQYGLGQCNVLEMIYDQQPTPDEAALVMNKCKVLEQQQVQ